jgi:hypothetical protein
MGELCGKLSRHVNAYKSILFLADNGSESQDDEFPPPEPSALRRHIAYVLSLSARQLECFI